MSRRIELGLGLATAGLLSCSLLVDTSGLSDSPDGTPSDAAARDASADAPALADGDTPPADAATDASVPDADAGAPCVGPGWFCDDFEGVLGARWSSKDVSGGTVTRVGDAKSGAFAMQAQVDALPGTNYANMVTVLPAAPSRIACDFELKVMDVPSNGEIDVIDIVTKSGGVTQSLYFASFDGKWGVYEYTDAGGGNAVDRGQPSTLAPAMGQWSHVHVETDFATLSMTIDGMAAPPLTGITPLPASTRSISFGITYASGAQSAALLVDDLACALGP